MSDRQKKEVTDTYWAHNMYQALTQSLHVNVLIYFSKSSCEICVNYVHFSDEETDENMGNGSQDCQPRASWLQHLKFFLYSMMVPLYSIEKHI